LFAALGQFTQKLPHPHVPPNLYELSSAKHKRRYFEEYGQPNRPKTPLTSIVKNKYYRSQWGQST